MYVCTGPCARKHTCKRRSEDDVRPLEPATLFFETGSLISLKLSSRRGCLANKPQDPPGSALGLHVCTTTAAPCPTRSGPIRALGTELRSSCLDGKYSTVSHLSSPGLEPLILLLPGFLTHFFHTQRDSLSTAPGFWRASLHKAAGGWTPEKAVSECWGTFAGSRQEFIPRLLVSSGR